MRLSEWLAKQTDRNPALALAASAEVSRETVRKAAHGGRVKVYALAARISAATGGAVTIAELCEPPRKPRRK